MAKINTVKIIERIARFDGVIDVAYGDNTMYLIFDGEQERDKFGSHMGSECNYGGYRNAIEINLDAI